MQALNHIQAEVWQNRYLPHVFFTQNCYSSHVFEPHFHEHWTIQVIEKGVNEGICGRKKYLVSTRELVFINPGEVHTGASFEAKPITYLTICPTTPFIQRILTALEFSPEMPPFFNLIHVEDSDCIQQFYQLWALSQQAEASKLALEGAALTLFSSLFRQYGNCRLPLVSQRDASKIQVAQDYLRDNYTENISLTDLSRATQLSPAHLIRCFQKETGQTPFAFLRNYRIEQAKLLLLRSFSISDVAQRVGFYDQSHFHAHFKRVVGITPQRFQGLKQTDRL